MVNSIKYRIDSDQKNIRLDQALCLLIPELSRSQAARLILEGKASVNKVLKKPGYRMQVNDEVFINTDVLFQESHHPEPEPIDLDLLFEDEHLMVVNKPAGLVVHPAAGNMEHTLVNAILHHDPDIKNAGGDLMRPGIVHRLDQDTSGLIVIARTRPALNFLQKEFKYRRVEKKYLAIVSGHFDHSAGRIELPIGRHPKKRKIMAVNYEAGKQAVTEWKIKERYNSFSLVEVLLKTGRTHQIRVHFYAIDHPLIGDPVYQPRRHRKKAKAVNRQMLHSWKISFRHPYSGQRICFTADPPEDFKSVLKQLKALESQR